MKAKEWIVATKLEWLFTKEEILTMYLNTVDFGYNSFGIKTASARYLRALWTMARTTKRAGFTIQQILNLL